MNIPLPKEPFPRPLVFAGLCFCLVAPAMADESSRFFAYVDSDICARLMLGPITAARTTCSSRTVAEGAKPVLVRLSTNMVLTGNKEKMLRPLVGQLVEVTGELNVREASVKLETVQPIKADSIPTRDPARRFLDPSSYNTNISSKINQQLKFQLARIPYVTDWDFISFTVVDADVILTGWTLRDANRKAAIDLAKSVPGVESVVDNIDVLPNLAGDNSLRYQARVQLRQKLSNYFENGHSDIRIIVKNGVIILIGVVQNKADYDLAYKECNQLPFVFKVFNLLQIREQAR